MVEPKEGEGKEKGMMEVDGSEERHKKWDGPLTPVRETPLQQKAGVSNVRRNYARLLEVSLLSHLSYQSPTLSSSPVLPQFLPTS